ncbi:MAG: 30S ribosomal protein S13 [archaeon]
MKEQKEKEGESLKQKGKESLKGKTEHPQKEKEYVERPEDRGLRLIVRVINRDLNGRHSLPRALLGVRGMGQRMALMVSKEFEKKTGISASEKLGKIPEANDKDLEEIIMNPQANGIPFWALNRQRDIETGETHHLLESDLQFSLRNDLQRMGKTKSYRGLRHAWGLTVRGQRTKSTHRGKGTVVGVMKKDARGGAPMKVAPAQGKPAAGGKGGAGKPGKPEGKKR